MNDDNDDVTTVTVGRGPNRFRPLCSPSAGSVEDSSSALFLHGRRELCSRSAMSAEGLHMGRVYRHESVMVAEVVDLFAPVPPGWVVDATVGGGGHAAALLVAHPHLAVLGLDRDRDALGAAADALDRFGNRVMLRHARFGDLGEVVAGAGVGHAVAGVLFDLGVSSPQLDRADRGFTYRAAGPLDMRMDQTSDGRRAGDLVNLLSEEELAGMFARSGERRFATRIARAVVAARPIATTSDLADVVAAAVPAAARRRGHPARRVFQALRMAVNEELAELERALPVALSSLVVGGRCAALSYHSGEDRLVKRAFAEAASGGCTCPPGLPCVCGARSEHRLVFRGSRRPTAAEVGRNHRAESARLRAVERTVAAREER